VTCREFADFIMDYLSGELSSESRAQFEYHLSLCTNCRKYLASYEESVKLGKRAFDDDRATLPTDVPEDLVQEIRLPLLEIPVRVLEEPAQVADLPVDRLLPLLPGRFTQDRPLLLQVRL